MVQVGSQATQVYQDIQVTQQWVYLVSLGIMELEQQEIVDSLVIQATQVIQDFQVIVDLVYLDSVDILV